MIEASVIHVFSQLDHMAFRFRKSCIARSIGLGGLSVPQISGTALQQWMARLTSYTPHPRSCHPFPSPDGVHECGKEGHSPLWHLEQYWASPISEQLLAQLSWNRPPEDAKPGCVLLMQCSTSISTTGRHEIYCVPYTRSIILV